ncbi:hypothetical protein [Clostridium sp.]|uniref:hyaluronate lyase N-terminal domain-containing protein n=1 Tax=Clostridium sp. TaxID=1506 RepID=UPI00290666B2|nr:hypothetical protein [Clostridium sp.]MDU3410111.1 hypothetical protein [Clostridium sp.]
MANRIQLRRGIKAKLPTLYVGEPALCTDTKEVFIGNGVDNTRLATSLDVDSINDSITVINGNIDTANANIGAKVNKIDIVNDLTNGGTTKVLSAEQGKALKGLIDNKITAIPVLTATPSAPIDGQLWFLKTTDTSTSVLFFDAYKNNSTNLGAMSNVSNRKAGIYFTPSRDFILDKIEVKMTSRSSAIHSFAEPITVDVTTVVGNQATSLILDTAISSGVSTADTVFTMTASFANNIKLKGATTYCFLLRGFSSNNYYYSVVGGVANNYSNIGSLSYNDSDGWVRYDDQEPDIKIYERVV